jgi:hypothetical protein
VPEVRIPAIQRNQLTRRGFGNDRSLKRFGLTSIIGCIVSIDHTGLKNLKKLAGCGL